MSDSVKSLFGYVPHNFTDGIEEPTLLKKKGKSQHCENRIFFIKIVQLVRMRTINSILINDFVKYENNFGNIQIYFRRYYHHSLRNMPQNIPPINRPSHLQAYHWTENGL